jgi:hypothetical protein
MAYTVLALHGEQSMTDIETEVSTDKGIKVSVSSFDDGAWLHMCGVNFTAYSVLTIDQAIALRDGLTAIIEGAEQ